jgi:hypothetical protein
MVSFLYLANSIANVFCLSRCLGWHILSSELSKKVPGESISIKWAIILRSIGYSESESELES